jgi:cytoskeleton protein RodZ
LKSDSEKEINLVNKQMKKRRDRNVRQVPDKKAGKQTLGDILVTARTSAGFSVEQIAERLKLDPQTVIYLEHEDYSKLPASVFIRGYLRNYANAVGINSDKVLMAYEYVGIPTDINDVSAQRNTQGKVLSNTDQMSKMAVSAGIIIFILMIFVWAFSANTENDKEKLANFEMNTEQATVEVPITEAPIAETVEINVVDLNSTAVDEPVSMEVDAVESEIVPMIANDDVETVIEKEAIELSQTEPLKTVNETSPVAEIEQKEPEKIVAVETVVPIAPTDKLVVNFSANCWLSVADSTGKKVLVGTKLADAVHEVFGVAPFSFVIGNPKGISLISVNGKAFDLSTLSTRKVARFEFPKKAE